jgi:hypothetical protein
MSPPSARIRRIARAAFGALILVLVLAALRELARSRHELGRLELSPLTLGGIAGLTVVIYVLMTWSVNRLVVGNGGRSRPWRLFRILMAGLAASTATPFRLGIPLRLHLYHRDLGLPSARAAATATLEVVISYFVAAVLGLIASFGMGSGALVARLVCLSIALVILLATFVAARARLRLQPPAGGRGARARALAWLIRYHRALRGMPPRALLLALAGFALRNVVAAARLVLVARALHAELGLSQLLYAHSLATLATPLSLLPAGLGTFDASLIVTLRSMGLSDAQSIFVALIQRFLSSGLFLILGAVSLATIDLPGGRPGATPERKPGVDTEPGQRGDAAQQPELVPSRSS